MAFKWISPRDPDEQLILRDFVNDPLFCYYLRTFIALYKRLYEVKPNLIQEQLAHDPWKVMIAVILLNKTNGKSAIPALWKIIERWPTPWALAHAKKAELQAMIQHLGIQSVRSKRLIKMSAVYLQEPPSPFDKRPSRPNTLTGCGNVLQPWTPISHLPGAGPYALDSYRIFCTAHQDSTSQEWKNVLPGDKELILYLKWKWAFHERKEWHPTKGVVGPVDIPYLSSLVDELGQAWGH